MKHTLGILASLLVSFTLFSCSSTSKADSSVSQETALSEAGGITADESAAASEYA